MAEQDGILTRDDLLREGHELLAAVLLRGALGIDIRPGEELGSRVTAWNVAFRQLGIVGRSNPSDE